MQLRNRHIIVLTSLVILSCTFTSPNDRIQKIVDESRKSFEQNSESLKTYNNAHFLLDSLLSVNAFDQASLMLDSCNLPGDEISDYRGIIEFKKGNTRGSISYFTQIIEHANKSNYKAISHRAIAYSKLGLFDSALMDIKPIALMNNDFSLQLAQIYEQLNEKDSALKYYRAFLSDYHDSSTAKKGIERLKKGS